MDIALANDEYYFHGLWATLLSLLAATPDASRLRIHVIDTGITDASWQRLADAVGRHPAPPVLNRKVFPRERLEGLNIPGPRSPLVYARLFLPELLECERVLYLDSDLLVFRDVLELESVDLTGMACAAVINEDAGTLDFDLSREEYEKLGLDPRSHYFNAGVLYLNLSYWRSHGLTGRCLDFLKNHRFRLADQSALNAVMNGQILPIDRQWNRLANHLSPEEASDPHCVIHYTTRKPWSLQSTNPAMILWRKFAEDTGLSVPPPAKKPPVWERSILAGFLRTMGYGLLFLWFTLRNERARADGYHYAFSYWAKDLAGRRSRSRDFKAAADKIRATQLRPDWLS